MSTGERDLLDVRDETCTAILDRILRIVGSLEGGQGYAITDIKLLSEAYQNLRSVMQ